MTPNKNNSQHNNENRTNDQNSQKRNEKSTNRSQGGSASQKGFAAMDKDKQREAASKGGKH